MRGLHREVYRVGKEGLLETWWQVLLRQVLGRTPLPRFGHKVLDL
jgi:hypothetical protein